MKIQRFKDGSVLFAIPVLAEMIAHDRGPIAIVQFKDDPYHYRYREWKRWLERNPKTEKPQ